MKKILLLLAFGCFSLQVWSQNYDLEALEATFLKNNLRILAARYEIGQAEAKLAQERVWPNPSLSLDNVNLWSNSTVEEQPLLFGKFGKKQQFGVELEQLIETAGKRKKRVAIRQTELDAQAISFEELLWSLKYELRIAYYQLALSKQELRLLEESMESFTQLRDLYAKQAAKLHVSSAAYYRIQSELLSIEKEVFTLRSKEQEALNQLKVLTRIANLSIADLQFPKFQLKSIPKSYDHLISLAKDQNFQIKLQEKTLIKSEQEFQLEKANAKPDLTTSVAFERGGNIMQNFVGIGVKVDLPLFNRNKGNIKAAKNQVEQETAQKQYLEQELEVQIVHVYQELARLEKLILSWDDQETESGQDLLSKFRKQLTEHQITLLEYLDFAQAYQNAQQAKFGIQENYLQRYEELQFLLGSGTQGYEN